MLTSGPKLRESIHPVEFYKKSVNLDDGSTRCFPRLIPTLVGPCPSLPSHGN